MITKKKKASPRPCWIIGGRLTFPATQLRSRTLTPGLGKRAAHRRSNGETRCLAERGRGRGSAGAGASVPAQRCRQIRLFRTLHTSSASFAARSFKDRVSANVLGAGKASDTFFFGEFRPHVQAPSFPRHRGSPSAGPRSAASTAAQGPSPNYWSPYTRAAVLALRGFILCNSYMF